MYRSDPWVQAAKGSTVIYHPVPVLLSTSLICRSVQHAEPCGALALNRDLLSIVLPDKLVITRVEEHGKYTVWDTQLVHLH